MLNGLATKWLALPCYLPGEITHQGLNLRVELRLLRRSSLTLRRGRMLRPSRSHQPSRHGPCLRQSASLCRLSLSSASRNRLLILASIRNRKMAVVVYAIDYEKVNDVLGSV